MDGGPGAAALGGGTASPGRITLWGIEVFVATAEERSISAAARRLGVSASAVSQQLTNLEAALAVTLLVRNARPVTLTPAGEAFRRRAQSILNEAAQARAELLVAGAPTLRRLRFGVIDDLEADVTPQLLVRMAARLEGCQFLLETGASHGLYDQLEAEALDVIVTAEMGEAPPWAEVHPILTEDFVVAAPKGMVDPTRPVKTNSAFGAGAHFCIGAPLARLELTTALPILAARCPQMQLAAPPEYGDTYHFHGLTALRVRT